LKNKLDKAPFSFLPEKAKEDLLTHFSSETIKKDTILLVQEISPVGKFLVLSQGSAQYYFEHNNEKTLQGRLNEGDNFGGISILLNDAVAIRTLKVLEDSVFLSLDAAIFLKTCTEFEEFKAFFTNAFGALMLNKSFAGIIARQIKDREFNLPFFNQPISAIFRPNIVTCPHDATLNEAAQKMAKNGSGSIFLKNEEGKIDAIITDADLRSSAIAKGLDGGHPASAIVSSPVVSVSADSQVFEAFLTMNGEDTKYLAVSSKANDIIGTISDKDLIAAQAKDTVVTDAFNGGDWPVEYEAIRVLRSSLEAAQAFEGEIVGESTNPWTGERYTMRRFGADAITKAATGSIEAMPHLAGESVGSVKKMQTAAEIIDELMSGAEALLGRWH